MSLTPGTRLGPYEVVSKIGEGGMGEVYRAKDMKLNRDAALKILPEGFTADPDRRARFTREAQVLASLNHPNIAGIYGVEDAAGTPVLAMEFVEGEDLSAIIARGAIPVTDALPLARQIAEALEAAHEQAIVHRDLKPANVKIRPDGTVKVLDFGLAKAIDSVPEGRHFSAAENSPTITTPAMTMRGMIMGTAAYMSPEQARGKTVDRRADIWAFGVVLYEMVTGRRAFEGHEISDVLAAVLRQDIDWTALPATTPPRLRRLLERCLDRDHRQRLRDIGEARVEIAKIESGASEVSVINTASASALTMAPVPLWRRAVPVVLGLVLAAVAALAAWTLKPSPPQSTEVTRFSFTLPEGQQFTNTGRRVISIAPDGSQFVYVANNRLYLKPMSEMSSLFIQGTEMAQGIMNPVFSPDSRSIAFYSVADNTLKRIAISGGTAVTIAAIEQPFGISWGTDDKILIGQGTKGILRVSASGGKLETVIAVKDGELAHGPSMLPGGNAVVFTLASASVGGLNRWNTASIVAQALTSGERKVLLEGGSDARYVPNGHLIYALSGTILAVPFDAQGLTVTGGPVPVIEGVAATRATGTSQFSISDNGSLVFAPGEIGGQLRQLTWFDRTGKTLETAGDPGGFAGVNLSLDGKRVAVHRHDSLGGDIWVYDASLRTPMRLTFDPSQDNGMPVWSPDGKRIAFHSLRNGKWGLREKNSDGTGAEDLLIESEWYQVPMSWSGDGQSIAYVVGDPKTLSDLWLLPLTGDRRATPLRQSKAQEEFPQLSPDGKWLAYVSGESGANHIYVTSFPGGDGKWQVSTGGLGSFPRWRSDGKELFYLTGMGQGKVMSVDVNGSGSSFVAGRPAELFEPGTWGLMPPGHQAGFFPWAVSPDGQRFLMPQPVAGDKASASPAINVILNWTALLNK